jgi:hypothetical protein
MKVIMSLSIKLFAPALLLMATIAGCGGGGSSTEPASQGSGTLTPAPNPGSTSPTSYWKPALTDTWQWQLAGTVKTSYPVAVFDIDLFNTPAATIQALQAEGKKVVCYFSAGSSENWRPDFSQFQPADMGNGLDGWPGERWLDTRSANVRKIMQARLDLAVTKGCNGVEPDNVDGYSNGSGFALSAVTQLDYNRFLASEAHKRRLSIALKNDLDQLADLVGDFDFAVNEQCHEFNECGGYQVFTASGKPVFNAEYAASYRNDPAARSALCADARSRQFHTLVLPLALDDSFRYSCEP